MWYHIRMDSHIAAWLAGLIDGEGSIYVAIMDHTPSAVARSPSLAKRKRYRIALSISGTSKELMDALEERVGFGTVYLHKRQKKENQKKDAYTFRFNATQLPDILPFVLPWLVVKRKQAELALEWVELRQRNTPRAGEKWDVWSGKPNPVKYHQRLAEIAAEISALNRKGRG